MNIIENIHELFIDEAKKSPLLFNDLASMENYISESYSGRSIIELIQNADDAHSSRMYIGQKDKGVYIVANNGRPFTNDDILALCRSGASTKRRNSDTIGYRGIGFKSVVNYAEVVHLVSGEIKTTFSRKLTKQELTNADKIPLIRVPHLFDGNNYKKEIDGLLNEGYTTIFVFEVKSNSFMKEMNEFSDDYLLFLQNIKDVTISSDVTKSYRVERTLKEDDKTLIQIGYGNNLKKWLMIENSHIEGKTAVAFKFEDGKVIKAENDEAVIHSFLPTNDKLSIKFKINGDFSTDPSRTRVVQDDATNLANEKSVELIADIFENILKNKIDAYGIVQILKDAMVDPLAKIKGESPNDILVGLLMKNIKHRINAMFNGKRIVLQPKGITETDFNEIIKRLNCYGIGTSVEEKIGGILEFLKNIGIEELDTDECLEIMKDLECSDTTRATIISEVIKDTRFGMSEEKKELLSNAKLFLFEDGVKSVKESNGEKVHELFEGAITEQLTTSVDYTDFAKRIGLKEEQLAVNNPKVKAEHIISSTDVSVKVEEFKSTKRIKKWKSVEKNVAAVLELLDDVVMVKDVSEQNIGYDLEAIFTDGVSRYYEVKSVDRLGDIISFSNNEYSTCVSLKSNYYLAIAEQTKDEISICFIKNPVDSLHFEKRITRWDWMCGEYNGEVINTKME